MLQRIDKNKCLHYRIAILIGFLPILLLSIGIPPIAVKSNMNHIIIEDEASKALSAIEKYNYTSILWDKIYGNPNFDYESCRGILGRGYAWKPLIAPVYPLHGKAKWTGANQAPKKQFKICSFCALIRGENLTRIDFYCIARTELCDFKK